MTLFSRLQVLATSLFATRDKDQPCWCTWDNLLPISGEFVFALFAVGDKDQLRHGMWDTG